MTVFSGPWRWLAARSIRLDCLANLRQPPLNALPDFVPPARSERSVSTVNVNEGVPDGAPSFRVRGPCPVAPSSLLRRNGSGPNIVGLMERPIRFEHARFLGDKRTQLVYDLDEWDDGQVIDEIVEQGVGLQFGPDTLVEARNRGYTLAAPGKHRLQRKPRS